MRARSLEMVRQPAETLYLDSLRQTSLRVIFRLWQDESLPIEEAIILSEWIWRHLYPSPIDWARTIEDPAGVMPPKEALVSQLAAILQLSPVIKEERGKAFRTWVESTLVKPLLPANAELLDDVAKSVEAGLQRIAAEIGHDIV